VNLLLELLINLAGPILVYRLIEKSVSPTTALILSSIPPIIWSVTAFVRQRRFDLFSLLVIGGIAVSAGAIGLGGSPRFLLVRESLITGLFGLVFLGSLLFPRPLIYHLAVATVAKKPGLFDDFTGKWSIPAFRNTFYLMTVVWGVSLIGESILKILWAFTWPIDRFLTFAPMVSYGCYFGLIGWTLWYGKKREAQDKAR
jgi:intracellular septation protein A